MAKLKQGKFKLKRIAKLKKAMHALVDPAFGWKRFCMSVLRKCRQEHRKRGKIWYGDTIESEKETVEALYELCAESGHLMAFNEAWDALSEPYEI